MKTLRHRGKDYKVTRSTRKNKKYKVEYKGEAIHFGAKGYRMFPNTRRGDAYCSRSLGIKGANDPTSANFWARKAWGCRGKKSSKKHEETK